MSDNLTNYRKNNINLTSPQKKSLKKFMLVKERKTGKPFSENHDPRFTTKQDAAANAENYLNELIEQHQGQSEPSKTTQDFANEKQDATADAVAAAADNYLKELIEKHQGPFDPVKTPGDFADDEQDEDGMKLVRNAWDHDRLSYQYKLNKFIEPAKHAKDALNRPNKGGKSRVFRKKSNKTKTNTKTKKVSRRNRRSRNIRRNSRVHKRK